MIGDLHPGQKLVEADLCRGLNVSRASLREALRALQAERLIELVPNRGPSVAKLGEREIADIHEVWALLTGDAVFRFTQLANDRDIEKLEAIVARRALRGANPIEQLGVTNAFFAYMSIRCGNEVLREMAHSLVSRLNFLRAQALCQDGWRDLCAHEINDILTAIRAKKPIAARQATKRHIESACRAATAVALIPRRDASVLSLRPRSGVITTAPLHPRSSARPSNNSRARGRAIRRPAAIS
jgi:DNA-binding GntR family transcriptional regulator